MRRIDSVNFVSCNLDGFSSVYDDILTTETLTAEDIVRTVEKNLQEEEENSEEQEIEVNVPTINEALQVIRMVHNLYEATSEKCN